MCHCVLITFLNVCAVLPLRLYGDSTDVRFKTDSEITGIVLELAHGTNVILAEAAFIRYMIWLYF